jgi:dihydrofolate reductase
MRKLIVCNIVSLDGYFEGPGSNVMALPMDGFFDEHNLERLQAADTLLLGATTYLGLKGFWPAVAENPEASPGAAQNPDLINIYRGIGVRNNEITKVVVSDSLTADDTPPWTDTTTIVPRARALWNDLLAAGLVDELHLMVGAAVLGDGTPAFGAGLSPQLRLAGTRRRDSSDNVLLRYEVSHAG